MKKLRLDVEELAIESFEPGRVGQGRGTVNARAPYTDPAACKPSNNWYCSVGDGCTWAAYTCAETCREDCPTPTGYTLPIC